MKTYKLKPYYDHIIGREETFDTLEEALDYYESRVSLFFEDSREKTIEEIERYGSAFIGDYIIYVD